ncbi:MAG: hypothetical protein JWO71_1336 [Candidatus Acidoferrum typicum]|nr:hypothetical protein [Candidatus Acidoferrum typicum]
MNAEIPRDVLGIPGAYYQMWVHNMRKGDKPDASFMSRRDKYRVVFTLSRHALDQQNLDFKGGTGGDSFIQLVKPENERQPGDPDEIVIFSAHGTPTGVEKVEIHGLPNKAGRLAQCVVELVAASFGEADRIAFSAVSGFFSMLTFEVDVPLRIGQLNVEQTSSQSGSMSYVCPYPDVWLTAAGTDLNTLPYIQSLLSLYREGVNSNSINYQFLCWYKIIEGINWKRGEEVAAQPVGAKTGVTVKVPEVLPSTKEEMRKLVAQVFPTLDAKGTNDERWDHVAPDEVLGWKFNRIRQDKLEPVRNKVAHMLTDVGGDLTLSPDSQSHRVELAKWISLLRLMARMMIRNERVRHPQPAPLFNAPITTGHISQLRAEFDKR